MAEEAPKPPEIDPEQVAQAAALENAPVPESPAVLPIEIQEVADHDTAAQPADDPVARDSETEARIQELRNRGRVGVLTEGTERPDTSNRLKKSEHDPEAIAAVNKANRLLQQQRTVHLEGQGRDTRLGIGQTFKTATAHKLNTVAGEYSDSPHPEVKEYFEDPEGWETRVRDQLKANGNSDEWINEYLDDEKSNFDRQLARIGERYDSSRDAWLQDKYEDLESQTRIQDKFRGDLLDLYARDPEKYKAMSTEEFVTQGREFRSTSWETAKRATMESWGSSLSESLPKLVENASSIYDFRGTMNTLINKLRNQMDKKGISPEELISFVEALEGKEAPYSQIPEDRADLPAYDKAYDDRLDTERRIRNSYQHGYFNIDDFAKDLDRSPREQMKEAVERAKVVTDRWVEAGKKARQEFEEKWGAEPQGEEPEPQAA